ncbi:MAG: hypothetical protein WCP07_05410 [bacterium]|jgi:hypothetical protein
MFDFLSNDATVRVIYIWCAALCTLGIYSILYKENKVYRFLEHLFLGLATGYTISQTWTTILKPQWWEPMTNDGQWWWALALPAGLLFYMVFFPRHAWMSRLIFGFFFGAAAGRTFQAFAATYFPLVKSAVNIPLMNPPEASMPGAYWLTGTSAILNNLLFLAIVISVMVYFFFSFEQRHPAIRMTSRFGRYTLMFAFGAIFGSTIMARMSLLIGRMFFLIHDWFQVTVLGMKG